MILKKLSLKNFQAHEKINIDFDKGINVIVGDTDKGKSSILRALNFLFHNTPRGGEKFFKKQGSSEPLSIVLVDSENNSVKRKDRTYELNGSEFKAFGSDVPQPIQEKYPFTKTNWQNQFDLPFMVFETPGQVSKTINSIIGLQDQEDILKQIKIELSEAKSESKRLYLNKYEKEKRIKELQNIPEYLEKINKLKERDDELEEKTQELQDIESKIFRISQIEQELKKVSVNRFITALEKITEKITEIIEKENSLNRLEKVSSIFNKKYTETNVFSKFISSINGRLNSYNTLKDQEKLTDRIDDLIADLVEKEKQTKKLSTEIIEAQNNFQGMLKDLGVCPLCEQKQ